MPTFILESLPFILMCLPFIVLVGGAIKNAIRKINGTEPPDESEEYAESDKNTAFSQAEIRSQRNKGLADIIGLVMKADGTASKAELKVVSDYLKRHFSKQDYHEIMLNLKQCLKTNNTDIQTPSLIWIRGYTDSIAFMELLFDIAKISKGINEAEWKLLFEIMNRTHFNREDCNYFYRKYAPFYNPTEEDNSSRKKRKKSENKYKKSSQNNSQNSSQNNSQRNTGTTSNAKESAYRILGLRTSATPEEIKKAYRILAKKYHPDTVQNEDMKKVLTEKLKEINLAYSLLMK